ncbi:MAG: AMP-binding protein, partial [Planctomycetaceae bacterium]|nr:AMP-binding protein [Planctomycetaceae bacterium]
ANQVGNCLLSEGFQQGDCFGVIMPVSFESIAIYLGIIQAGMVTVSIADSFAGQEIDSRLQIANAKAVFSYEFLERSGKRIPLGDRVRDATALPVYTVATDAGESGVVSSTAEAESWQERLEGQPTEFEAVVGNPSDPINVLFSSGTTGDPKAIPWNHTTPIKCAMDGMLHLDLVPGDVVAWPTNLGWMMGP